jgi:hypothetical protein
LQHGLQPLCHLSQVSGGLRVGFVGYPALITAAPIKLSAKLRVVSPCASKRLPDQLGGSDALLRGRDSGAGISHRLCRSAAGKLRRPQRILQLGSLGVIGAGPYRYGR